jgi:hypothetical protein
VKLIALLMVFFQCFGGNAQQPSHFLIGTKEFANIDVYSLLERSDKQLFAATNYGLFVYRHGSFQSIQPAKEQHGSSLFCLTEDSKGAIYCCNLAGQIFKLEGDRLKLFVQVPKEFLSSSIEFTFDSKDHLILRSSAFLRYDSKNWELIYAPIYGTPVTMNFFDRSRILFPPVFLKEIFSLESDSLIKVIQNEDVVDVAFNQSFSEFPAYLNNSLVSISVEGRFTNWEKGTSIHHQLLDLSTFCQFGKNEIWGLGKINGVRRMHLSHDSLVVSDNFFKDQFISCITKSGNGTIFLGTFNTGVIVIPNSGSTIHSGPENDFTGICATSEGVIVVSRNGSIFDVAKERITLYKEKAAYPRTKVMYAEGIDFRIDSARKSVLYNAGEWRNFTGIYGVLKGVAKVDENTGIIAATLGLFRVGNGADHLDWKQIGFENRQKWTKISNDRFRCKSVAYNIVEEELYYETQEGLVYVNKSGKHERIRINGKVIACNHLMYADGVVWCSSESFGVLKILGGKIIDRFDDRGDLVDNYVRKTQLHEGKLYVSHKSGFQIVDLSTLKWKSIGAAEGITNGSISDFVVFEDRLWVVCYGQIISLPLNQLEKQPDFILDILTAKLGSSPLSESTSGTFAHNENHLTVNFEFRGVEFESDALVQYRLIGANNQWKNLASTAKEIEFNALAPGEYQFEIRVKYRNYETEPIVYPFTIEAPFWQRWWFYSLIALTIIVIVVFVFRIRLKKAAAEQKRRLAEQKLQTDKLQSELKALRSQMNPHFIFNSLNSIQDLVLREETETSYDYIALFAKLVRNTLNYSNADYIPVDKELEFLDVYLSLEKLRFAEDFEYSIQYNGHKDIDVPSLLIQPFIENALVHGLIHKKGLKKLEIQFALTDKLTCTITDNGVGRARGEEIRKRQKGDHESFALSAIQQRLEILNQQVGEEIGQYTIVDLFDEETPIGTQVEVTIPYRSQFDS